MKTFWLVTGLTCCVSMASAQTAPIRQGSFEVGGFVGSEYGASASSVMGGGNVSYAVTKNLLPYVEYSYFPSVEYTGSGTISNSTSTFKVTYPAPASDFHVGVHIRFPIKETRLAPYGVFGIGSLTNFDGTLRTLTTTNPTTGTICQGAGAGCTPFASPITVPGASNLAINFGGGLRYYITPRYGMRVEVKGYKPLNVQNTQSGLSFAAFNNSFIKAEVGFFFQFR